MSANKKGFIKAGAVLAIVESVFLILMSFIFLSSAVVIDEQFVIDTYKTEPGYQYVEEEDGGYHIEYNEVDDGFLQTITVTDDEIKLVVTISRVLLFTITAFCFGLSVAQIVIAILNLNKLNKNESKKSLIITLLVLSILTGGIITSAFMIVALCLKDKKPELENSNEIVTERLDKPEENSSNN